MKHINLLDVKKQAKHAPKLKLAYNLLTIIIVSGSIILLAAIYMTVQHFRKSSLEREVTTQAARLDALNQQNAALKPTETGASPSALANRVSWAKILDDIAIHIPSTVALTHISGTIDGKRTMTLTEKTDLLSFILDSQKSLEQFDACSQVKLLNIHATSADGKADFEFQLECPLK